MASKCSFKYCCFRWGPQLRRPYHPHLTNSNYSILTMDCWEPNATALELNLTIHKSDCMEGEAVPLKRNCIGCLCPKTFKDISCAKDSSNYIQCTMYSLQTIPIALIKPHQLYHAYCPDRTLRTNTVPSYRTIPVGVSESISLGFR